MPRKTQPKRQSGVRHINGETWVRASELKVKSPLVALAPEPEQPPFIAFLADKHAANKAAGRVCNAVYTRGKKKGQKHGDFAAGPEYWGFHQSWCATAAKVRAK